MNKRSLSRVENATVKLTKMGGQGVAATKTKKAAPERQIDIEREVKCRFDDAYTVCDVEMVLRSALSDWRAGKISLRMYDAIRARGNERRDEFERENRPDKGR